MHSCLAPEKKFFLENVAVYRLQRYLSQMPGVTFIEDLEKEYRLPLSMGYDEFIFYGKVDRIDRRGDYRLVLDYKTGWIEHFAKSHFEKKIIPFFPSEEYDYESLKTFIEVIRDLQLPLYVLLVSSGKEEELARTLAAYVELRKQGEERYFVHPDRIGALQDHYMHWFGRTVPSLLNYILTHMIESPFFYPATDERACQPCDYEPVCRFSYTS